MSRVSDMEVIKVGQTYLGGFLPEPPGKILSLLTHRMQPCETLRKNMDQVCWLTAIIPALWEARWVDHKVKRWRPSWWTWWNPVSSKNTKISWAWWCTPVAPATQEAEAGELLEPRRWRFLWAEMAPLQSSLGNKRETQSQKNKKRKKEKCLRCQTELRAELQRLG